MLLTILSGTFALALFAGNANAAALSSRQATTETVLGSFYAYGEGLDGLPVIWSDETAFIGLQPPQDSTTATNVTFHDDSEDSTLTVTPNTTETLSATTFFVDNSAGAFEPAGFTSNPEAADGLVTSGFIVFGNQLVLVDSSGALEQLWWAMPTETEGVWTLRWNVDTVTDNDAVPVVVKNVAPVPIGSGST